MLTSSHAYWTWHAGGGPGAVVGAVAPDLPTTSATVTTPGRRCGRAASAVDRRGFLLAVEHGARRWAAAEVAAMAVAVATDRRGRAARALGVAAPAAAAAPLLGRGRGDLWAALGARPDALERAAALDAPAGEAPVTRPAPPAPGAPPPPGPVRHPPPFAVRT